MTTGGFLKLNPSAAEMPAAIQAAEKRGIPLMVAQINPSAVWLPLTDEYAIVDGQTVVAILNQDRAIQKGWNPKVPAAVPWMIAQIEVCKLLQVPMKFTVLKGLTRKVVFFDPEGKFVNARFEEQSEGEVALIDIPSGLALQPLGPFLSHPDDYPWFWRELRYQNDGTDPLIRNR